MLDLIVITVVMMPTVLIAVAIVHEMRRRAHVLLRQRLHRMSKPRVMGDSAAKKH